MFIKDLIIRLRPLKTIYIQTHDFPDHDAVASAFALQRLLENYGIESRLVYEGTIQRDSLQTMIAKLGIPIRHISEYAMTSSDPIVIVDGCKGNKNITDLIGDEICVIDHHLVEKPDDVPFADIRPECGACSTIITDYYRKLSADIRKDAATALMIGLSMDTALMTRSVSELDVEAYSYLYHHSDIRQVNTILRNYIQVKEIPFFRSAMDKVAIDGPVAFCYFDEGCSQNLLGILGDFFLAFQEIDFVALFAKNDGKINLSFRSEDDRLNASEIAKKVVEGIGFGGGHADIAGGIITDAARFSEKEMSGRLVSLVSGITGA